MKKICVSYWTETPETKTIAIVTHKCTYIKNWMTKRNNKSRSRKVFVYQLKGVGVEHINGAFVAPFELISWI